MFQNTLLIFFVAVEYAHKRKGEEKKLDEDGDRSTSDIVSRRRTNRKTINIYARF